MNTPTHSLNNNKQQRLPAQWVLRSKLAMELFPSPDARQAVAKMHYWISRDPYLYSALLRVGYRERSRFLNRKVVALFRDNFG